MKTITLQGVPYSFTEVKSDSKQDKLDLFVYGSTPPIPIGSYDPSTEKLTLDTDWKTKSDSFLNSYRATLAENTRLALEKARALQNS